MNTIWEFIKDGPEILSLVIVAFVLVYIVISARRKRLDDRG